MTALICEVNSLDFCIPRNSFLFAEDFVFCQQWPLFGDHHTCRDSFRKLDVDVLTFQTHKHLGCLILVLIFCFSPPHPPAEFKKGKQADRVSTRKCLSGWLGDPTMVLDCVLPDRAPRIADPERAGIALTLGHSSVSPENEESARAL